MKQNAIRLDIPSLHSAYRNGGLRPGQVIDEILERSKGYSDRNIWIRPLGKAEIQPLLDRLADKNIDQLPLYGIPFAIKDNIDLANIPTTAACPAFAYTPGKHAHIVALLIEAGAIPVGKTNLDQFATGLVGTRSPAPWGPCANAFDPEYISGGSSSGSAVAVSLGLATFALGTDTAGSGRVPAMLNNLYGHKPTRGLLSMSGVVPACRSLDCPSIFALSAADAQLVFSVAAQPDPTDSYSRPNPWSNTHRSFGDPVMPPKIAIPMTHNLEFFGNQDSEQLFEKTVDRWKKMGSETQEIDITPLLQAAKLLYEGPWVAERYAAIEAMMQKSSQQVHPVVHDILLQAQGKTAVEAFKAEYRMQQYRSTAKQMLEPFDFLMTPTAATTYTIRQVLKDPVRLNSNMGYYTNYMNLLDLCGTAIPAGFMGNGMPFGVTLVAPAMQDQKLLSYAHTWQKTQNAPTGAQQIKPRLPETAQVKFQETIQLAVCGAHLTGMPLNWQLRERGATLQKSTKTSNHYQMVALAGDPPQRPGLFRSYDKNSGASIDIEIWSIPTQEFGSFVANIPPPLGIGKIETRDGAWVSGFICEPCGMQGSTDISHFGAWKNYLATDKKSYSQVCSTESESGTT